MNEYREAAAGDLDAIRAFLAENGWASRVADTERFGRMIENATRTVVALDDNRIVGFARSLCDGVSNGYIGTVAVAEDKRGQGIGREYGEAAHGRRRQHHLGPASGAQQRKVLETNGL